MRHGPADPSCQYSYRPQGGQSQAAVSAPPVLTTQPSGSIMTRENFTSSQTSLLCHHPSLYILLLGQLLCKEVEYKSVQGSTVQSTGYRSLDTTVSAHPPSASSTPLVGLLKIQESDVHSNYVVCPFKPWNDFWTMGTSKSTERGSPGRW